MAASDIIRSAVDGTGAAVKFTEELLDKVGSFPSVPVANTFLRGIASGLSKWAKIDLSKDVTGVLASANSGIGTGIAASTCFETAARFTIAGSGTSAFGATGLTLTSTTAGDTYVSATWNLFGGAQTAGVNTIFELNPKFLCSAFLNTLTVSASNQHVTMFIGLAESAFNPTAGSAWIFPWASVRHCGFSIEFNGTTTQLFATQSNGTTQDKSAALATVTILDTFEFAFAITSGTSTTFTYRQNGGTQGTVTLNTYNPVGLTGDTTAFFGASHETNGGTNNIGMRFLSANYIRA